MLRLRMLGLLMLMFVLCDADSMCLMELDPPIAVQEYGTSVSVNCTTTYEDPERIYLRVGNTNFSAENVNFLVQPVTLLDWDLTAECTTQLNESLECNKDLEFTIYKNPEKVFVFPTNHADAAVEGKPYELHCDVLNVAPVQNLIVRWYKNNQTIMTGSVNTTTTKTPADVSSTLTVNISRGESGAQFRCEAQLDFGPHGPQLPVMYDTRRISVHYAPELKNNILRNIDDVFVDEGADASLTCEAEGNPPPVFNWNCDDLTDLESMNSLNITQLTNSTTCHCTATNYLGNVTKQINVHVIRTATIKPAAMTTPEAATQRGCPLILTPAEVVVRFGDPVSVNCSTSATDVFKMGWEASVGGSTSDDFSTVIWVVEELKEWTIQPKCFVTLTAEQCEVPAAVTLYKTPDIVVVSALDRDPVVEGEEYLLKCDIIQVAPVQKLKVKWYQGSEVVHTETFDNASVTPVDAFSLLTVTAERGYNRTLFRCEAELHLGPKGPEVIPAVQSSPYTAVVLYKPQIQACPDHYTGVENEFSLDKLPCQADGNPSPTVQWYYEGKRISVSERLTRTDSGEYTAHVRNGLGETVAAVNITIEYSPSFTCSRHYELQDYDKLQTKCEPTGMPPPVLTLIKDGKEMKIPQRWTRHDGGEYLLRATNTHGTANHSLYLDVLYAPLIRVEGDTMEVTPGENVTLTCSAEGNPIPLIHWEYTSAVNVKETTGGHQRIISVTGATSTNAGVYRCVATNKVGTVSKPVSLSMKVKAKDFVREIIWVTLIVLIILAICAIIFYLNRRKKHRKYSFVPDNAKDGSNIPMTTTSNGVEA
ncbi:vascular cell adhesion protein 1 isoform X2 [Chaetodon auriga]|uniref:vascular cell adhesion protein 1 isoform X2 n=1 Tax=Chaetodon auriga TaxID=39042 RepID=UPI004032D3A3